MRESCIPEWKCRANSSRRRPGPDEGAGTGGLLCSSPGGDLANADPPPQGVSATCREGHRWLGQGNSRDLGGCFACARVSTCSILLLDAVPPLVETRQTLTRPTNSCRSSRHLHAARPQPRVAKPCGRWVGGWVGRPAGCPGRGIGGVDLRPGAESTSREYSIDPPVKYRSCAPSLNT